jgi:inner membrane protein
MLLFGHVGITAAVARAGDILLSMPSPDEDRKSGLRSRISSLIGNLKNHVGTIDYRLVIVGSMLPDIIDKPLFLLLGNNTSSLSGRDYAHTLLFNLVLLAGGFLLLKYNKSWLLVISLSSCMHLILDRIWEKPVTFLWPFRGGLVGEEFEGWSEFVREALIESPENYIPEIIGLIIVMFFAYRVVKDRSVIRFIKDGRITGLGG